MKDEAIEEIRSMRRRISEEFGHDPQKYIDYLKNQSIRYSRQIELYWKLSEQRAEFSEAETAYEIRSEPNPASERTQRATGSQTDA